MKHLKLKKVVLIIILLMTGIFLIIQSYMLLAPQFGRKPDKKRLEVLVKEARYEKGKFHNREDVPMMLPRSFGKLMKASRENRKLRRPERPLPSVKPELGQSLPEGSNSVTWLGHSTLIMQVNGKLILTDPVFGKRASPVGFIGPKAFEFTDPILPGDLPEPDIILLTHDHYDHLDYRTIKKYYRNVKLFLVPLGVRDHLERWGVDAEHIIEFDWWQEKMLSDGLTVIATPAQHFSGRRGQNNSTLWCSWIVQTPKVKIFFSGDSGYNIHFAEIGERHGPFNLAFIECGAYGRYWPNIHMRPEESVQAALDVRTETAIPVHWGKYNLSFHPWEEPVELFISNAAKWGLAYTIPKIGETLTIGETYPDEKWWR